MESCDYEVQELLAGVEESIPTEEQEAEAIALQRNTPLSAQEYESEIDQVSYQFEMCETNLENAGETLVAAYPKETFDSPAYQHLSIHKYLTNRATKFEFYLGNNEWGTDFANYPKQKAIRMRKGVVSRFNRSTQTYDVYHMSCIDTDSEGFKLGGFSKALLTVEARNILEYFGVIVDNDNLFFCKYCEHYMFDCVEFFDEQAFRIPPSYIWPYCEHTVQHSVHNDSNEESYVILQAEKLICIVSPQEPPRKRQRVNE